jgi:hypothetical protein
LYPFTYKVSARSPAAKMGRTVVTRGDGVKKPEMAGRPGSTVTAHPPEQRRIAWTAGVKRSSVERAKEKGSAAGIRRVHAPECTAPRPSTRTRLRHRLRTPNRLRRNSSPPRAGVRMPVAGRAPRSGGQYLQQYQHLFPDQECGVGHGVTKRHAG